MSITSVTTNANLNASGGQVQRKTSLDQLDFMNLLVVQLQNQNPLEPMDSSQMAAQMAQLGSLEALTNMNSSMQQMVNYLASTNSMNAAQLIGKKVEATGSNLAIDGGVVSGASYQLAKAGTVTIKIYDSAGQLVRTIDDGAKDVSKQQLTWDGKDQTGMKLPDGTYKFEVSAVDKTGQSVTASTWMVGTVKGVSFENGITYLTIGSGKITLSSITSILG
jgi:flagellar basal-body rod modification protein FlgD